jgi:hypothetical protein
MGLHCTDFLFPEPTLARGVASIVDFWGLLNQYNISPTSEYADALALSMDWNAVGWDMAAAIDAVVHEVAA